MIDVILGIYVGQGKQITPIVLCNILIYYSFRGYAAGNHCFLLDE